MLEGCWSVMSRTGFGVEGMAGLPGGGIAYAGGTAGEATADAVGLRPDWLPGGMAWPTTYDGTLQAWLTVVPTVAASTSGAFQNEAVSSRALSTSGQCQSGRPALERGG